MKICEFTEWQLRQVGDPNKPDGVAILPTPMFTATRILINALSIINQAGLDGKRLDNIRVVSKYEPAKNPDDQIIEIHADVHHRLATPTRQP